MNDELVKVCDDCGGTGWVIEKRDQHEVAVRCPNCRTPSQAIRLRVAAHIPPRYLDLGFGSFIPRHRTQERALKLAIDYVEDFPSGGKGLLLVGPCGVGKTHLSVAILEALINEKGVHGRFIDETDLLRRLQYSYGPDSNETERDLLQPLRDADLLIWDDLGTSRSTEWVRETIRMVINHRYTYDKATIFSTNRAIETDAGARREESLEERIGLRLYSRILEMCQVVPVEGPDARRSKSALADASSRSGSLRLPKRLRCPKCQHDKVEIPDNRDKSTDQEAWLDLGCRCLSCEQIFVVRFYPAQNRVEYL